MRAKSALTQTLVTPDKCKTAVHALEKHSPYQPKYNQSIRVLHCILTEVLYVIWNMAGASANCGCIFICSL